MKVLVAGATGAIGKPLLDQLAANGHSVVGLSRSVARHEGNVRIIPCDVLRADAVERIVAAERPGAIVSQLTRLPKEFNPRSLTKAYAENNRVRLQGTMNLLAAAERHGVSKFVAQSSGFWYAPTPGDVKTEGDPLWQNAPEPIGTAVRACLEMEHAVKASRGPKGVLLRYATFYGPGTWFSAYGTVGKLARKRQYPIIGDGSAVMSFIHIDDAAAATVAAVERPVSGVYNISDDEPAATKEWLPAYAEALGAKRPRQVPPWLAKLAIGSTLATYTMNTRGAENSLAKDALAWRPRYPSWRQGFQDALG